MFVEVDHHPTPAPDIWGQRAIAMPTLTLAPTKPPLRVRARFTGEPGPGRTPAAPAEVALVVPMPQVRSRAQIVAEALKHGLI